VIIKTNNFAGYVAPPGFTSVKATFKVPRLTCSSTSTGLAPAVDLIGPEGLDTEAGVEADCPANQWVIYFTINGHTTTSIAVSPGNTMTATASETLSLSEVKVKDDTTGATEATSGAGGAITTILIGDLGNFSGPNVYLPPSRFSTDPFTNVTVGGMSLGTVNPTEAEWVYGKTVWLATGAIQGGNAFTVTFKKN